MRIAVNTRLLVPGKMDGIGWFAYEVTRRMAAAHPEHSFLLLFDRKPDGCFDFPDNCEVVVLAPQARHPVLWWLFFEVSVRLALKRLRADVFLSPDGFIPLHGGVPSLAVIHDVNFEHSPDNLRPSHQRYMTHFFPRFAHKAARIATVSEFSRRDIAATYRVPEGKIDVVYDGAGDCYRPHSKDEMDAVREKYTGGRPYIIFVSTILKRKNLATLLRAFDLAKDSDAGDLCLVVVGNRAWWGQELAQTFDSMKFKESVIFLGHLEQPVLAALLSASRALVYPSLFEGFGIPVLEAMYAETAVIASNTTSLPEVGGDAAIYTSPLDHVAMAHAISSLRDDALRCALIEKGRVQRVRFSWDNTACLLWNSLMQITKQV